MRRASSTRSTSCDGRRAVVEIGIVWSGSEAERSGVAVAACCFGMGMGRVGSVGVWVVSMDCIWGRAHVQIRTLRFGFVCCVCPCVRCRRLSITSSRSSSSLSVLGSRESRVPAKKQKTRRRGLPRRHLACLLRICSPSQPTHTPSQYAPSTHRLELQRSLYCCGLIVAWGGCLGACQGFWEPASFPFFTPPPRIQTHSHSLPCITASHSTHTHARLLPNDDDEEQHTSPFFP